MKKLLAISVLMALVTGCSTQTAHIAGKVTDNIKPTTSVNQHFFVFGIGQQETLNVREICGSADKVNQVETVFSGTNVLVSVLTIGIYMPRTANVYCK
ncbi:Bor family protein [Actinobacillus equuli subsp. equuli]|uniref:Bor/Iss family lipoprotein n=1 Tax=Actinobacillus equuli TaxID=718 RepID=UPI0024189AA6|nr:lipoprotein bor [Actinobacillus equuli]MDG4952156.1 Bor family protein [Actinobacillus equuli subsp. equuli]WGE49262.1 Bor family protein [Actinobacillus equuli subsp. equuli]WGE55630.1 Bor family protein [Actinobacillus equuli subsp. equuli]WGE59920.1 Bor family protein [Actinobacillus equuli subsp. haemolyticus]WGE61433.1 Bor family protein [Actinobacillus equuli subsp. haemolyticus]